MRPRPTIALALAAAVLAAAGCSGGDDEPAGPGGLLDVEHVSSLDRFDSCDEVRGWVSDELAPRVGAHGFPSEVPGGMEEVPGDEVDVNAGAEVEDAPVTTRDDTVVEDFEATPREAVDEAEGAAPSAADRSAAAESAPAAPSDGGDAGASDQSAPDGAAAADADADGAGAGGADGPIFSDTNVQVEGVDEPDIVKTDGTRILAIVDDRLHLASAAEREVLDSVDLPGGLHGSEMLLAGDRLLVFGSPPFEGRAVEDVAGAGETDVADPALPSSGGTTVVQVDIAGQELQVSDTFELDGTYVSARMVGEVARLVVHADPQHRFPFMTPAVPSREAEERAEQANRDIVEEAAAEDFLPQWRQVGPDGEVTDEGMLLGCEEAHAPESFSGFGMVSVVSIDLADGLKSGIASANGAGVMAGGQTVYSSAEHLYVAAPEWVDWSTLPEEDWEGADERRGTNIHRFDISDPTQAVYDMSGWVAGELLNQFAMDEHDGHLRVATTTGSPWAVGEGESDNHVFVLAPDGDVLRPVGSLSGLGQGETIHSVRFMGDVGYVVTFRETDPLYTVDLSDPADPRTTGELKILGYSAYLHPIGDDWLLGVGQDATEGGGRLGTQVSLFDVRDPAAPTRVAQATLPGAESAAEWDHRAFLWWAATNLVAIPVTSYDGEPFDGLIGYTVDVEGEEITELGRVAHLSEVDRVVRPGPSDVEVDIEVAPDTIMRSFVIDDELWTLSAGVLGSTDLATLEGTTFVELG